MTFKDLDAPRRTNESFRNKNDPSHHKATTPLLKLPINLVDDFPVGDALHLLHLGLMKRFLIGWCNGHFGYGAKWSANDKKSISEYLINCCVPSEIHRKMRSLSELCRWKGTEHKTFLLYISIVVLKNHISKFHYEHFLLFYCSIAILNSEYFMTHLVDTADEMINYFLHILKTKMKQINFTSNVHNLCHLVDEVKLFGPLGNFDTYPFENKLQDLKKLIRQRKRPLIELAKRIMEQETINHIKIKDCKSSEEAALMQKLNFDSDNFKTYGQKYSVFGKICFKDFRVINEEHNKWFFTVDHTIVACKYVVAYEDNARKIMIYGSALKEQKDFFVTPIKSSTLFIYAAKCKFETPQFYSFDQIICKMFSLKLDFSYEDSSENSSDSSFERIIDPTFVFIPLWHTLTK